MSHEQQLDGFNEQLDRLLKAYREACPDPEPSSGFMPRVWQKVEARRSYNQFLRRWAQGFVTAAAALSLLMVAFLAIPRSQTSFVPNSTYVEVLASNLAPESLEAAELVLTGSEGENDPK